MRVHFFFILAIAFCTCSSRNIQNMKNPKAELLKKQQISSNFDGCGLEDGENFIFYFIKKKTTRLFRTENKYIEELLIEFRSLPQEPTSIDLTESQLRVCYKAGGQNLDFMDDKPEGSILINTISEKKITGSINLKVNNQMFENESRNLCFNFQIKLD